MCGVCGINSHIVTDASNTVQGRIKFEGEKVLRKYGNCVFRECVCVCVGGGGDLRHLAL